MDQLRTLRGPALRRFVRHFVEMLIVMGVGMAVLGALESLAFGSIAFKGWGWDDLLAVPEGMTLIMAGNMSFAMIGWMRLRGHGWAPTLEMAASMLVPFVVLLPLLSAGLISLGVLMTAGHVLMVLAMLAVMLRRVEEYTGHHHGHARRDPTTVVEEATGAC